MWLLMIDRSDIAIMTLLSGGLINLIGSGYKSISGISMDTIYIISALSMIILAISGILLEFNLI